METSFATSGQVWNSERGEFISTEHQAFAGILKDYNPCLSLVYIPMNDRGDRDQFPFAILEDAPGKEPYIVRYMTEEQMLHPEDVLTWLFEGDLRRHRPGDILTRIELREKAQELLKLKKREEELEDIADRGVFAATGGRDKLHTFKIGDTTIRR